MVARGAARHGSALTGMMPRWRMMEKKRAGRSRLRNSTRLMTNQDQIQVCACVTDWRMLCNACLVCFCSVYVVCVCTGHVHIFSVATYHFEITRTLNRSCDIHVVMALNLLFGISFSAPSRRLYQRDLGAFRFASSTKCARSPPEVCVHGFVCSDLITCLFVVQIYLPYKAINNSFVCVKFGTFD